VRALLAPCVAIGCAPEVDPAWLVERPTELAISITVETPGRYTELPDDATRRYHEALPLDTIRIEPFVVDRGGPIPASELSVRWVACPTIGCLDAIANADQLPACATGLGPLSACLAGDAPSILVPLPDFPPDLDDVSLAALAGAPSVALVASRAGDPGADVCARRLRAREPLGPCMMMLRGIQLGSLGSLVEAAQEAGIEVDLGTSSEELLGIRRNFAPLVQRFAVSGSSLQADGELPSQSTVAVAVGDDLEIEYLPSDDDAEHFEFVVDGLRVAFDEVLTGRWWLDRSALEFTPLDLRARWTVSGDPGLAHVYFVVNDGRGSEAWGWLAFEVSD
jgi:hypothetical protein